VIDDAEDGSVAAREVREVGSPGAVAGLRPGLLVLDVPSQAEDLLAVVADGVGDEGVPSAGVRRGVRRLGSGCRIGFGGFLCLEVPISL
jgi:hypothetical protein